jgi:hypothetical protein
MTGMATSPMAQPTLPMDQGSNSLEEGFTKPFSDWWLDVSDTL